MYFFFFLFLISQVDIIQGLPLFAWNSMFPFFSDSLFKKYIHMELGYMQPQQLEMSLTLAFIYPFMVMQSTIIDMSLL